MATIEVTHYPNATVISVWPFDTPEEEEQWLERFKESATEFYIAAQRDIANKRKLREREEKNKEE